MLEKDLQPGEHLNGIADKMGDSWKNMSHLFKLENSEVEDIINGANQNNPKRQRL